ncbi:hypothetical protein F5Y04DRAFT_288917 [Hypomontagnella monticulosa]|nr:hypothetical protein F5Y04DRAFT_288917 [Hypomontagnella monticulosa]
MDRSSRLDSDSRLHPESRSDLPAESRQQFSSQDSATFLNIFWQSLEYGIHWVELNDIGTLVRESSAREAFSLGSGLTSQVIRHVTGDEIEALPPDTVVALKVFIPRDNGSNSSSVRRKQGQEVYKSILTEIRTICRPSILGHPNIVQLLFLGWQTECDFPILALELGDHGSLDQVIRARGPEPTTTQKQHIVIDIALGLRAIHRAGLVHGDLKTSNVLIMTNGHRPIAKLTDFGGSSQAAGPRHGQPTHITPLWSAPEVVNQDPDIDWEKADIYSYGLVVASLWCREDGGYGPYGSGPLHTPSQSSSCLLSSVVTLSATDSVIEDIFWALKSAPHSDPNSLLSVFAPRLKGVVTAGTAGVSEFLKLLPQTLQRHFWLRPNTNDLVRSLHSLAKSLRRDIPGEENFRPKNPGTQEGLSSIAPILLEHFSRAFRHANESFENDPDSIIMDIPELYSQGPTKLLEDLAIATFRLVPPKVRSSDNCLVDQLRKAYIAYDLANSHISGMGTRPDMKRGLEWMCISALCGYKPAMRSATAMIIGTDLESQFPTRLYLSLLSLSRCEISLQKLSVRWPAHYRVIRALLIQRSHAYDEGTSEFEFGYLLSTLQRYIHPPPIPYTVVTLQEALEVGDTSNIKKILRNEATIQGVKDLLPRLLHQLSRLVDTEAATIAPIAFEKGAKLDILLPCKSPILGIEPLIDFSGSSPSSYSPLSAAISHGKTELAEVIISMHEAHNITIPDFRAALLLSFRYLQHKAGKRLLKLLQKKPSICNQTTQLWKNQDPSLLDLLIMTMSRHDTTELERAAICGGYFYSMQQECVRTLIEMGADPYQETDNGCPLFNALISDDLISLKIFCQHRDFSKRLKDLGNAPGPERRGASTVLQLCIASNSIRCFEFLVGENPYLTPDEQEESSFTLLQFACSNPPTTDFLRVLLDHGFNALTHDSDGGYPLGIALMNAHIPAAELIVSRCTDAQVAQLFSRDPLSGESIFSSLISLWTRNRHSNLLDYSFPWIASHGGAHFYGVSDTPIWEYLFSEVRPGRRSDQIRDARLLDFLLKLDVFKSNLNKERWQGRTLLHCAAINGHYEVLKILMQHGVDVKAGVSADDLAPEGKDFIGFTALDLVLTAKLGSHNIPEEIEEGGQLEIQKWRDDINSIITLLLAKDGSSSVMKLPKLRDLMSPHGDKEFQDEIVARFTQKFNRDEIQHEKSLVGAWPRPLPSDENNKLIERPSTAESHSDMVGRNRVVDILTELIRVPMEKERKKRRLEGEARMRARHKIKEMPKELAQDLRNTWRLPPEWSYVRFNGNSNLSWFQNVSSGEMVSEKPALHRGDNEGKEKETKHMKYGVGIAGLGELTIFVSVSAELSPDLFQKLVGRLNGVDRERLTPFQLRLVREQMEALKILGQGGVRPKKSVPETVLVPLHVGTQSCPESLLGVGATTPPQSWLSQGDGPRTVNAVIKEVVDIYVIAHGNATPETAKAESRQKSIELPSSKDAGAGKETQQEVQR